MTGYDERIREEYGKLTRLLIERGIRITVMESVTSGLISSLITDTEGASAIFRGAFVTYSNEAKISMGVPADIIDKYGVYSSETSAAMASACREKYIADIGIGVTGTTGNVDPENPECAPGEVFFSIDFRGNVSNFYRQLSPRTSRYECKMAIAFEVVQELCRMIN